MRKAQIWTLCVHYFHCLWPTWWVNIGINVSISVCFCAKQNPSKAGLVMCAHEVKRGEYIQVCLRRAPCCDEGRRGVSEHHLLVLTTPLQSIISSALSHRSPSSSGYSLLRLELLCSHSHSCLSDLFSASVFCLCTWEHSSPVQSTWDWWQWWGWAPQNTVGPLVSSAWIGVVTPTGLLLYGGFLVLFLSKTATWSHSSIWLEPPHAWRSGPLASLLCQGENFPPPLLVLQLL